MRAVCGRLTVSHWVASNAGVDAQGTSARRNCQSVENGSTSARAAIPTNAISHEQKWIRVFMGRLNWIAGGSSVAGWRRAGASAEAGSGVLDGVGGVGPDGRGEVRAGFQRQPAPLSGHCRISRLLLRLGEMFTGVVIAPNAAAAGKTLPSAPKGALLKPGGLRRTRTDTPPFCPPENPGAPAAGDAFDDFGEFDDELHLAVGRGGDAKRFVEFARGTRFPSPSPVCRNARRRCSGRCVRRRGCHATTDNNSRR